MELKFRKLRADEIDCRISTVNATGISLLLYKDARCDMNILDETVGPMNWTRAHSRDNANCTVSIWDAEKKIWVSKEDTGTESYTEKEKGLASDSFKRACFNWGIGRELYTAPFIWVPASSCDIKEVSQQGKKKYTCYDRFSVTEIKYDDLGRITALTIENEKTHKIVFGRGKLQGENEDRRVNAAEIEALKKEALRTGMNLDKALQKKNITKLEELPRSIYLAWMEQMKPRQSVPGSVPEGKPFDIPEGDEGLPFV